MAYLNALTQQGLWDKTVVSTSKPASPGSLAPKTEIQETEVKTEVSTNISSQTASPEVSVEPDTVVVKKETENSTNEDKGKEDTTSVQEILKDIKIKEEKIDT